MSDNGGSATPKQVAGTDEPSAEVERLRSAMALAASLLQAGGDPDRIGEALRQAARLTDPEARVPVGEGGLEAAFERHSAEYCNFAGIERPLHARPDLCAFLMLDALTTGGNDNSDMVCAAEHDEIWLDVDLDKLAKVITDEEVRDLGRCGVSLGSGGLYLFV